MQWLFQCIYVYVICTAAPQSDFQLKCHKDVIFFHCFPGLSAKLVRFIRKQQQKLHKRALVYIFNNFHLQRDWQQGNGEELCACPDVSPSSDVAISGMEIRSIAPLLSSCGDTSTFIHKTFLFNKDIFRYIYLCSIGSFLNESSERQREREAERERERESKLKSQGGAGRNIFFILNLWKN